MRIAVIGAGVSGLTAAYLLGRAHHVELFERNGYAGGHAHSVIVPGRRGPVALDTGFLVYNERTYPGFTRLLRELGVATQASDMSLGVRCDACGIEYSSRGLRGMLAQGWRGMRPGSITLGYDILRFYRDARRTLRDGVAGDETLAQFLRRRRYGGAFVRHFIMPLAAAVWSTPTAEVDDFPARYFLRFLLNHGIIGLQPAFVWRTVRGGSRVYVDALLREARCRVMLDAPVRAVRRCRGGVEVVTDAGDARSFDRVVLACHADEALAMLGEDADDGERAALAGFEYTSHPVTLHTDERLLPRRAAARASWNYWTADCRHPAALGMTFHLNRLQALDEPQEYCVSLNAAGCVRPERVIAGMTYAHPRYTFWTLAAQRAVEALQGARNTYYAGAHLGYGFHEDGLQSAVRVAGALGVRW